MRNPESKTKQPLPLKLGTKTQWGEIYMVGFTGGERYYWMINRDGTVSMMPWFVVE